MIIVLVQMIIQFLILYYIVMIDKLYDCQNDIQIQFIILVDIVLITGLCGDNMIYSDCGNCVVWCWVQGGRVGSVWCGHGYYVVYMCALCSVYMYTIQVVYGVVIQTQRLCLIDVYTSCFCWKSPTLQCAKQLNHFVRKSSYFWLFQRITFVISGMLC